MKNDLLTIGSFTVHGYGLMIAIGVIAAYMMAEYRAKKKNMDPDNVLSLVIWALVSGYIGSKLGCIWWNDWRRNRNHDYVQS